MQDLTDLISKGNAEKVRELIAKNPSLINSKNEQGLSALMIAMYHGKEEIARMLIEKGAELSFFDAAAIGREEIVNKYLESNPSLLNQSSVDGFTALHLASFFGQEGVSKTLIDKGANVNLVSRNSQKVATLHSSVTSDQTAISRLLLEHGANPNMRQ